MSTTIAVTHGQLLRNLADLLPRPFLVITMRADDLQVQVHTADDFEAWLRLGVFGAVSTSEYEYNGLHWRQIEARAEWHGFRVRLIRCEQAEVTQP